MAETKVETKKTKVASTKKAAPKKAAPKKAAPKAAAQPQLTKEEIQAAMYEAVKTALTEVKAAEAAKAEEVAKEVKPEEKPQPIKKSGSEKLLNAIAYIYLIFGLIASVGMIAVGIYAELTTDSFFAQYQEGAIPGYSLICAGLAMLLPILVQYAILKLYVNISHRLSSIDAKTR